MSNLRQVGLSKNPTKIKITNYGGFSNLADAFMSDEKLQKTNPEFLKRSAVVEAVKSIEKERPMLLLEQYEKHLEQLKQKKLSYKDFESIAEKLMENFVDSSIREHNPEKFEEIARQLLMSSHIFHEDYEVDIIDQMFEDEIPKHIYKVITLCNLKTCRCNNGKPVNHLHFRVRRTK